MQDKDGGVFDGVYTTDSDITNPESDRSVYTIAPKSASAAITFAAVCALCSNVFRRIGNNNKNNGVDNSNAGTEINTDSNNPVKNNIYLTYADRLAEAAIRAWLWYDEHKKHAAGVTAGAVFWALCELLRLTGEEEFAIEAARELETVGPYFFTPSDMSGFGVMAVFFGKGIADLDIRRSIMESLRVRADNLSSKVYRSVITVDHFPRYSNMFICADAIALTVAAVIFRSDDYKSAARRNFDYLCGANPLSKSFITGFGSDPVRHPHEALSASDPDTDPIPGMLVFGATSDRLSDNYLKWQLPKSTPPAKSYGDVPSSRSTNGTNMKIVAMLYFLAVNM
jgi:endoglucanase